MLRSAVSLAAFALLAACADTRFAADVTRFHMAPPSARGSVFIVPADKAVAGSLEFANYAGAVGRALSKTGFSIVPGASGAELLGTIHYEHIAREAALKQAPFTVGIGGGSFGRNVGIGVGTSFGVGKKQGDDINVNSLSLQLKRTSDSTVVWEGRAVAEARSGRPYSELTSAIPALADALLRDFPGQSGKTVTYKQPN